MPIFTEKTVFLELQDKVEITKEYAEKINIDYEMIKKGRYQNWYMVNDENYYGKILNDKEILNYLLCEKIANSIYKLQTAHFIPAKIGYKTGLASLNFRKSDKNYFYANQDYFPFDNPNDTFPYLEQFFSLSHHNHYQKLINDLLKLISFHIYTGLRDLIDCNLLFQKEAEEFSLSPLYDFDFAFENGTLKNYHYKSSICHFDLPSEALDKLLESYPNFRKYLLFIFTIDMKQLLEEIEQEYYFDINELYKSYYLKQDKIKKDFIKTLHL